MNLHPLRIGAAVLALGFATACGSTGMGDILGSPDTTNPTGAYSSQVTGTVDHVDTRNREIVVRASDAYRSNLRNGGDLVAVAYDSETTVRYQNRDYRPEDLEPGDEVRIDVDRSGNQLVATDIAVTYDATAGSDRTASNDRYGTYDRYGNPDPNGTYDRDGRPIDRGTGNYDRNGNYQPNGGYDRNGTWVGTGNSGSGSGVFANSRDLEGTVSRVDTRNRTLELTDPSGRYAGNTGRVIVEYDPQTVVEYQGRRYDPGALERGDVVQLDVRDSGGRLLADRVVVVADARSSTSSRY